jgi:uncharacterized protein YdaU (DUF1376 family)
MTGLIYARVYPRDWRTGTIKILNLEEEGLYIRSCMFMYETGLPVPGDARIAAKLLDVQIQKYEKVMGSLIQKGKMIFTQGVLINERVIEELARAREESSMRSTAAAKREARKRQIDAALKDMVTGKKKPLSALVTPPPSPLHQPPHQPPYQPMGGTPEGTLGGAVADLGGVAEKIPNKIKPPRTTTVVSDGHGGATTRARSHIHRQKAEVEKEIAIQDVTLGNGHYGGMTATARALADEGVPS